MDALDLIGQSNERKDNKVFRHFNEKKCIYRVANLDERGRRYKNLCKADGWKGEYHPPQVFYFLSAASNLSRSSFILF